MNPRLQIQQYSRTMVQTSHPEAIVRMLVDAALGHVIDAQQSMRDGDLKRKGPSLTRANDIVLELMSCLDFQRGGEIAIALERLYVFLVQRLTDANVAGDPDLLDVAIKILRDLSLAWAEVAAADSQVSPS